MMPAADPVPASSEKSAAPPPGKLGELTVPRRMEEQSWTAAFAAEHGLDPAEMTRERLWILSPLQLSILEMAHRAPPPDWESIGASLAAGGHSGMTAAAVRELHDHAARHLALFESGWQWMASSCECSARHARNRFKLASREEAETAIAYFGIGGPRREIAGPDAPREQLRLDAFMSRIRGSEHESPGSLRRLRGTAGMSDRLRGVLSNLFEPEKTFTEAQIESHVSALAAITDWSDKTCITDLALSTARYLHYEGPRRDALRTAAELFLSAIPDSLWRERSLAAAAAAAADTAGDFDDPALGAILRAAATTDRVSFLGELVLGMRLALYADGITKDEAKYAETREFFIASKYRLLVGISKEVGGSQPRSELIQSAVPGLIASVESYDPSLGLRFSSHAYWPIKRLMKQSSWSETRERTGIAMKTQSRLEGFERDCERAGLYPLNLAITDEGLHEAVSKVAGAPERTLEEVKRLRTLLLLMACSADESTREFLPGSKISLNTHLSPSPHGGEDDAPEREVADPRKAVIRDRAGEEWIKESLRKAWEEAVVDMYLDRAQLKRDLDIYRAMRFGPKQRTAPEIAAEEGVAAVTVRRAAAEMRRIFSDAGLSLTAPDGELVPVLRRLADNPDSVERNLRIFRKFSAEGVSSVTLAREHGIHDSNVRQIFKRLSEQAAELGLKESEAPEAVLGRLEEAAVTEARAKAAEEVRLRMRVVERVALAHGETHEEIGTSFGFSGRKVGWILEQARHVAERIKLREAARGEPVKSD